MLNVTVEMTTQKFIFELFSFFFRFEFDHDKVEKSELEWIVCFPRPFQKCHNFQTTRIITCVKARKDSFSLRRKLCENEERLYVGWPSTKIAWKCGKTLSWPSTKIAWKCGKTLSWPSFLNWTQMCSQ